MHYCDNFSRLFYKAIIKSEKISLISEFFSEIITKMPTSV